MTAGARAPRTDEPRTLAPLGRRPGEVLETRDHGAYRMLWVADGEGPPDPRPGQFYMLATEEHWGSEEGRPYLPRAFSHARVEGGGGVPRLGFMLDRVGPGTGRLWALTPGERVWLAGPFGVGFRLGAPIGNRPNGHLGAPSGTEVRARPLLVGGGIGTAPILALADELRERATVLLGFRSSAHAGVAELFRSTVEIATDDGSRGRQCLITDLLAEELDSHAAATVYACGPPPMLEAVRALCSSRGVRAQLALESGMACGYGACFGCVVPTRRGFLRLCVDGPVLDADLLETALFPGAGH